MKVNPQTRSDAVCVCLTTHTLHTALSAVCELRRVHEMVKKKKKKIFAISLCSVVAQVPLKMKPQICFLQRCHRSQLFKAAGDVRPSVH